MPARTDVKEVACRVRVSAAGDAPRFEWGEGRSGRTAIRDAITLALRDANPDDHPAIMRARPAMIDLRLTGPRFGSDDLGQLLPVLEDAAGVAGDTVRRKLGSLDIVVTWRPVPDRPLDTPPSDVAQRPQEGPSLTDKKLRTDTAFARLKELSERLIPAISDQDIAALEGILRDAQREAPADHAAFVERVNTLLDVFSLRIKTETGEVGRMSMNQRGSLQITRAGGGTRGFKNATITLVGVERIRVGNRYTGDAERNR